MKRKEIRDKLFGEQTGGTISSVDDAKVDKIFKRERRKHIAEIRAKLAVQLIEDIGISMAETGRQLGVSTSAISKILKKR